MTDYIDDEIGLEATLAIDITKQIADFAETTGNGTIDERFTVAIDETHLSLAILLREIGCTDDNWEALCIVIWEKAKRLARLRGGE